MSEPDWVHKHRANEATARAELGKGHRKIPELPPRGPLDSLTAQLAEAASPVRPLQVDALYDVVQCGDIAVTGDAIRWLSRQPDGAVFRVVRREGLPGMSLELKPVTRVAYMGKGEAIPLVEGEPQPTATSSPTTSDWPAWGKPAEGPPCPFCGGARLFLDRTERPNVAIEDNRFAYSVHCASCAAAGAWAKSEGSALSRWGMRPEPATAPPSDDRPASATEGRVDQRDALVAQLRSCQDELARLRPIEAAIRRFFVRWDHEAEAAVVAALDAKP